jgi:hypothetical protein
MVDHEEQQADELDLYLEALQAGQKVDPYPSLPTELTELLGKLVEIQQTSQLNPGFAGGLEERLQKTAAALTNKIESNPIRPWFAGLFKGITNMKPLVSYTLASAAVLAVILLAFILLNQNPGGFPIAQISTQTPTSLATPQSPTSTPEIVVTSAVHPSATSSTPTAITTLVPPTPTLVLPTSAPSLPLLTLWLGSGNGGGGGFTPGSYQFNMTASLSSEVSQAAAYLQRQPAPFNIQQAAQLAARLGLDQPQWYDNVAIQEPRQLVFADSATFDYVDHSVFNFPVGRYYYPPDSYPPADLAARNARAFLDSAGLLNEPYTFTVRGEYVFFYRLLASQPSSHALAGTRSGGPGNGEQTVYESFALVTISPDGRVGMAHFSQPGLDAVGVYPLISSEKAWQILSSAQQNPADASRVYIRVRSTASGNPRIWTRTYQAGQQADIYGPLTILLPSEAAKPPYIRTATGLLVQGSAGSLQSLSQDYHTLVETSMDQAKAIHIWGAIKAEAGYQALELSGWDSQSFDDLWQGTLERGSDKSVLQLADGSIQPLAGQPVDAPNGQKVFVEGFLKDGRLEWTVIQDYVENPPAAQNVNQAVSINEVELAYLAPQTTQMAPNIPDSIAMRTLQPVWCFSGLAANGDLVQVFVQAVDPTLISK